MAKHLPSSNKGLGSVSIIDKMARWENFLNKITVVSGTCDDVYFKILLIDAFNYKSPFGRRNTFKCLLS